VLISETTHNVLADTDIAGVGFSDLGEHELKGLPRPERIRPSLRVSASARSRHRRGRAKCLRGPRAGARGGGGRTAASGTLEPRRRREHTT
jgi:hypothetical protein